MFTILIYLNVIKTNIFINNFILKLINNYNLVMVYCVLYLYGYLLLLFYFGGLFIPSRNLDEVFTYNHMAIMYLQSRSQN